MSCLRCATVLLVLAAVIPQAACECPPFGSCPEVDANEALPSIGAPYSEINAADLKSAIEDLDLQYEGEPGSLIAEHFPALLNEYAEYLTCVRRHGFVALRHYVNSNIANDFGVASAINPSALEGGNVTGCTLEAVFVGELCPFCGGTGTITSCVAEGEFVHENVLFNYVYAGSSGTICSRLGQYFQDRAP